MLIAYTSLYKKGLSLFIIEFYFDSFKAEFTDVYHEFETNALYYDSQEVIKQIFILEGQHSSA